MTGSEFSPGELIIIAGIFIVLWCVTSPGADAKKKKSDNPKSTEDELIKTLLIRQKPAPKPPTPTTEELLLKLLERGKDGNR